MQVESEGWLSDEESIRKAVAVHFAGVVVKGQDGWLNYEAVQEFGRRYNPNPNFVDLLIAAYNRIDQSVREA